MSSEPESSSRQPQRSGTEPRRYAPLKLACTPCRSRRVKCDHVRPTCGSCAKSGIECEFPSGRKRKRTKIEGQGRAESRGSPVTPGTTNVLPDPLPPSSPNHHLHEGGNIDWLTLLNASTPAPLPYAWPNVFGPDFRELTAANPLLTDMGRQMPPGEPSTAAQLMSALQKQVPTLQGDPLEDQNLQLYYYRFSGPTAIQPGIHRINLRLQRRLPDPSYTTVPQPESESSVVTPIRPLNELHDDEGMPLPHIRQPLFELSYQHLSQHFPAISRRRMDERFESGTMSAFLANCICACAARFAEEENVDQAMHQCAPFIAKAQEVIVSLTQLPTTETTSGLILLAWASYGQGNESGLWQWSGMAVRMGLDIGIHEVSEIYDSQQHVIRTRLLFWTLFITDRIISFSAGRQTSINEDIVEIPLPEDQDFFPDPARDGANTAIELVEPVPFVSFVRLMVIVGRISNVLNGRRGKPRTLVTTSESQSQGQLVADLQIRLVQFYSSLPDSLRWTSDNFKHQNARGHGGMFLALHLWAHAVLALTYHPTLLQSPSGNETPLNQSITRDMQLALVSSRQINECVVFADLVSRSTYICAPYSVQPLFVGTMAMTHEIKALEAKAAGINAVDMMYISMARQSLAGLIQVISRVAQVWAGADTVLELIEKRTGLRRPSSNALRNVYISLPDLGLLRRFKADKNHPNNVAQPTETSLRESIARSSQNGPSPLWLQDLMSTYTVENTSLEPIGAGDVADLLSTRNDSNFHAA